MKKLALSLLAVFGGLWGGSAFGAISFTSSIQNGFNTYQDQSFDLAVDVDRSGTFNAGDVLYGFARLDDRIVPPAGALIPDSTYMVFSQQVSAVASPFVSFVPTTVAGLTLSDLTGGDTSVAGGIFALYQDTSGFGNLIGNNLGVPANIGTIIGGSFILSAGFGQADDFFTAIVINPAAFSFASVLPNGVPVGFFTAGLTVLEQPGVTNIIFNELVTSIDPLAAGPSLHELAIGGGSISGLGNSAGSPAPYSYADQLEATINATVVPEPSTIVAWLGLGCCSMFWMNRRRNSK